ncbi:uncharacterized protein PV09_08341 [Verruconis gallopava]|uniref:Uncharacterized protein n=1 Tax=Verruconis gallopava TaxID=253628 RepID=A0A0D1XD58_9PEZI|nr:uncharacterized protein PV09_08341 [Verruconis gallopava]KIW00166.1 hypothetical protein PV09_08341 [Verruconis gallopava]
MILPKGFRIALSAVVLIFILFALLPLRHSKHLLTPFLSSHNRDRRLHLLIVATSSNLNFCRLFLSSSILSYPAPVLIDWEGAGEYNASETHLAKVSGVLRYLRSLPRSKDDDLILMVDGYDVIFQLGPDVLIKRYFDAINAANDRLTRQFGTVQASQNGVRNSILLGPDKQCWPYDLRRLACYAVPESPLPPKAFGPLTDDDDAQHARPRWLNSGTIIGPAVDLRKMFEAVVSKINKTFDDEYGLHGSDQLYLSDVWGDQEFMRELNRPGSAGAPKRPDIPPHEEVPGFILKEENLAVPSRDSRDLELHMGLDYESRLFQTVSFYEKYIDWITFEQTPVYYESESVSRRAIRFPEDVRLASKPFSKIHDYTRLSETEWTDVPLGVNVVTGFAFPVLHFTGDKSFRDSWWNRMWFYPYAERLLHFGGIDSTNRIGDGRINDANWFKDEPYNSTERLQSSVSAWSDTGKPLGWDELCKVHETLLFQGVDATPNDAIVA